MTLAPDIPTEVKKAVERVLSCTFGHPAPDDLDTSDLVELLDAGSPLRSIIAVVSEQRRPAFAKERRKHFQKAAKLAGELHALLRDERFPIWHHLRALDRGSGFPIGEWEPDPWAELAPLASFSGAVNALHRLQDRLEAFIEECGDEPLVDPTGFSRSEMLITSNILTSFNRLVGRDRYAPAKRSRHFATSAPGGPFVRYAVAVMKELGIEVSAETVMSAIRKKAASGRNGAKLAGE
jgi:hypothetical protein